MLKAVTADGRDVTDTPIDLRSGQRLSNVAVVFTDKLSEINGTLTDDRGTPITDYTVLAFPADSSLWRPQAAADHDRAAGSDRQVSDPRSAARASICWRRSIRPNRVNGSSRRFSITTAAAPPASSSWTAM